MLVLPNDNGKVLNHLNFNDIGVNTLKESQAFKKIRQSSKTFTTNLVLTPGTLIGKYNSLYDLYLKDSNTTDSINYGNMRQHNMTATLASTNVNRVSLDTISSIKLINQTLGVLPNKSNNELRSLDTQTSWVNNYVDSNTQSSKQLSFAVSNPVKGKQLHTNQTLNNQKNPSLNSGSINPLTQVFNTIDSTTITSPQLPSSYTHLSTISNALNKNTAVVYTTTNEPLTQYSPANQNIRAVEGVGAESGHVNFGLFDNQVNSLVSNVGTDVFTLASSGKVDCNTTNRLISNRLLVDFTTSPILTNNPFTNGTNFDT